MTKVVEVYWYTLYCIVFSFIPKHGWQVYDTLMQKVRVETWIEIKITKIDSD